MRTRVAIPFAGLVVAILLSARAAFGAEVFPSNIFQAPPLVGSAREIYDAQKLSYINIVPKNAGLTSSVYFRGATTGQREPISDPNLSDNITKAIASLISGETVPNVEFQGNDIIYDGKVLEIEFRLPGSTPNSRVIPDKTEQAKMMATFVEQAKANAQRPRLENFLTYKKRDVFFGLYVPETDEQKIKEGQLWKAISDPGYEQSVKKLVDWLIEGSTLESGQDRSLALSPKDGLVIKEKGQPDTKLLVEFFYLERAEPVRFTGADRRQLQLLLNRHARYYFEGTAKSETVTPTPAAQVPLQDLLRPGVVMRSNSPTERPTISAVDYVSKNLAEFDAARAALDVSHSGFGKLIDKLLARNNVVTLPKESLTDDTVKQSETSKINVFLVVRFNPNSKSIEVAREGIRRLSEKDRAYAFLAALLQTVTDVRPDNVQIFVSAVHRAFVSEGRAKIEKSEMKQLLSILFENDEIAECNNISHDISVMAKLLKEKSALSQSAQDLLLQEYRATIQIALDRRDEVVSLRIKRILENE